MPIWKVELRIYQSFANPIWGLDHKTVKKILKILAKDVNVILADFPKSQLPYIGLYLYYKDEIILICTSRMIIYKKMNVYESISDVNNELERCLVNSAPKKFKAEMQFYQKLRSSGSF